MVERNEYDLQREERIRRNRAMLAKLQVHEKAEDVAAPILAAQQQQEAAKESKRKKYVATGPARQSKRAGAEKTRAKLQQQAQDSAESSASEQSVSSTSQENQSDDSASKPTFSKQSRKRSAQEADFDPADVASQSSSDTDAEDSDRSGDKNQLPDMEDDDAEDRELQHALAMSLKGQFDQKVAGSKHGKSKQKGGMATTKATTKVKDTADNSSVAVSTAQAAVKGKEKVQKHATRKAKKGKSAGRVGLINPTAAEIKTAFSMLNPHNRSVIGAQDIARVALEHGFSFDDDELNAMMEAAASITQRASTNSMTFQGFQQLVENLSTVT